MSKKAIGVLVEIAALLVAYYVLLRLAERVGSIWVFLAVVLTVPVLFGVLLWVAISLGKQLQKPCRTRNIVREMERGLGCRIKGRYSVVRKVVSKKDGSFELAIQLPADRMAQLRAHCETQLPQEESSRPLDIWVENRHFDGKRFEYCREDLNKTSKDVLVVDFGASTLIYSHNM